MSFKGSVRINGDDRKDDDVNANTSVQEKNITFLTDAKLHKKIVKKTWQMVWDEELPIRQSQTCTLKKLSFYQLFRNQRINFINKQLHNK